MLPAVESNSTAFYDVHGRLEIHYTDPEVQDRRKVSSIRGHWPMRMKTYSLDIYIK